MVQRKEYKTVPKQKFKDYSAVANHFFEAAELAMELGYWTAAGVLIVHSAIAFSDALCIKLSGVRSIGENHEYALVLLERVSAEIEGKSSALNQLKRIIEEKTKVSYLGELYSASQIKDMWKRLERFRKWALYVIER